MKNWFLFAGLLLALPGFSQNIVGGLERRPARNGSPRPLENYPNSTVEYGTLTITPGQPLRTIVTKSRQRTGRQHAVLLIQWLSCSTVEVQQPTDGVDLLVRHLAGHPDVLFMRVEKPGVGDSQGDCAACDLHTEMAMNRAALAALKQRPDVDTNRIILLGISLGASLSPLVGQGQNIRGYLVTGGCTETWFEHMMGLERRRLALTGETPAQINAKMARFATLYQRYYIEKMTPGDVERQLPHLRGIWYDQPDRQYGRPAAFYHQVQDLNFEAGWASVRVPTLIVYGEYDWIMTRSDHQKIADIVNANRSGLAQLHVLPKADHSLGIYASPKDAFDGKNPQIPTTLTPLVDAWLRKLLIE